MEAVHVEEDLKAGVEALVRNLEPEVTKLFFCDLPYVLSPPPRQGVKYPHRKLLRVLPHPCHTTISIFIYLYN